jgi:tRNA modification GTPase
MLPRMAQLSTWYSECGSVIDQGLSLYFPGPRSFTGEDVVELQAHGGIVVMDWLVQSCISLGARHARPGEFSERAFLNGKLDLAQAEAVADLIDAASREAAVCASRSLQGAFSQKINRFLDILTQIRTHIEAAIDFVDEDLETDDIAKIYEKLVEACQQCKAIIQQAQTGVRLHEGARIAIVGAPNAGKSSLLNHLAQTSAAIVSDIPGTTRDVVKERIVLRGVPVEVLDTAGLRITEDPIEQQGIDRAKNALADADLILWIFDVLVCRPEQVLKDYQRYLGSIAKPESVLCLGNKIDLLPAGTAVEAANYALSPDQIFFGAIHTGQGISTFIDAIMTKLGVRTGVEGQFIARRRHVEALTEVLQSLENARDIIKVHPLELTAEELRLAQNALARITGEFTSDDLLGKIFSSFCVGK